MYRMSSYSYCVRITRSYELCRQLVDIWQDRCEKVAVYEHVGQATQKTHIHMVLCNANVCKKQLKNLLAIHNITTQGHLGGNKDWSFKEWDGDENACAYMTKGFIKYSFLKGWTDKDHERWLKMWRGPGADHQTPDHIRYDECFDEYNFPIHLERVKQQQPLGCTESIIELHLYREFNFIKQWSRDYVFRIHGRIWNIQAINKYKTLVYSYCFRNNVVMNPRDNVFKQY